MAGHFQNQYPNPCRFSPNGYFGSKFVTVCVTGKSINSVLSRFSQSLLSICSLKRQIFFSKKKLVNTINIYVNYTRLPIPNATPLKSSD